MGKYNGAIITTAGQNLIASAIAGGNEIYFTKMQVSSYAYPSTTDFLALTSLQSVEDEVDIVSAEVYGGNIVQVSSRVDNSNVAAAYLIETLGLFAKIGENGTNTLVAVITAETPDQMPVTDPESPSAFIYNVQMTVQNADSITVTVNPAGTVTVEMLRGYVKKIDLDYFLEITVPTTGWAGSASPYTKTVTAAGVTAASVPFVTVSYANGITRTQKKAVDKAAALFTGMTTGAGQVTISACDIPATAVTLALRGI
ncbi:MAG: phage tail protein [Oscillospiraceae bacterium]|nr:phage tail protein [Oscillospiraceae bacterium]